MSKQSNKINRINKIMRTFIAAFLIVTFLAPASVIPLGFSSIAQVEVAKAQEFDFDFGSTDYGYTDTNFDIGGGDYDYSGFDSNYDYINFEPYTPLDFSYSDIGGGNYNSTSYIEDIGGGNYEQSDIEDIGGGNYSSTEIEDIGGGSYIEEEGSSFPWYLGLLALPFLFNRSHSDSNSSAVATAVTPAPVAQGGNNPFVPCPTPTITSSTSGNGTVGTNFTYFVGTQSDRAVTITTTGLPAGLSFINGNTISGTPTVSGTFTVNITVSNACGSSSRTLTIVISPLGTSCPVPVITSTSSGTGTVGNSFAYVVTVQSDRAVNVSTSGLPNGLTLNGNTISGTPTVSGTFNVTITATNSCGTDTEVITITINPTSSICVPTPTIVSLASANAQVGYNFSHQIIAQNTNSITVSGLPSGLSFSSGNNVITGVPNNVGTYSVIVTATNNCGSVTQVLTIVITEQGQQNPPTYYPPTNYPPTYYPPTYYPPTYYPPYQAPGTVFLSQTPYNGFYLSEVPYTGAGDVLLTMLYVIALILVSAAVAYTSVYGNNYGPLAQMIARLKNRYNRFVNGLVGMFYFSEADVEEEEGEAEGEVPEIESAPVTKVTEVGNVNNLIETARSEGALLKENAAHFILEVAEQNVVVATSILRQVITTRLTETKADEFVLLSENVVREVILATYLSLVPVYARLMKEGKEEKAKAMILKLVKLGYDSSIFLSKVDEYNASFEAQTLAYQTA